MNRELLMKRDELLQNELMKKEESENKLDSILASGRWIASTGEEITENSTPDMDDWGWDDYWSCEDWMAWHKIMKEKKGKQFADSTFLSWWNKLGSFAATYNCRSFNTAFRDYFRKENLLSALYSGIGIIAAPIGVGTDVAGAASDVIVGTAQGVGSVAKTLKYLVPILVLGGVIYGGFYIYKQLKK
jgi:hypothetical protein